MRKQIGVFVAACLYYSGLVNLVRWWTRRSGSYLTILNYHCATGGDLRRHLLYLRRHYRLLPLEEALQELYTLPEREKRVRHRRPPLALTFDDGYQDNYTHAFALARELRIPMTIFLIPGYLESGDYFWWLEGKRLVQRAQVDKVTIEGRTYHLKEAGERNALTQAIDTHLRHAKSVAEREAFLRAVSETLDVPSSVTAEEGATLPMTWAQVREMEESGWVSFGAHTMHHPILAYLANAEEVRWEVEECRRVLEQQLGHPVRTFAYPVGQPEHISDEALRAVRMAGYDWAVTTTRGNNTPQSAPHQLRRILSEPSRHWLVLAAETSGVWRFFSPLWKNPLVNSVVGRGGDR
jgi:peptidoglycan/xylan/chitin deacetylase (PgdA/CDA1 family)